MWIEGKHEELVWICLSFCKYGGAPAKDDLLEGSSVTRTTSHHLLSKTSLLVILLEVVTEKLKLSASIIQFVIHNVGD